MSLESDSAFHARQLFAQGESWHTCIASPGDLLAGDCDKEDTEMASILMS